MRWTSSRAGARTPNRMRSRASANRGVAATTIDGEAWSTAKIGTRYFAYWREAAFADTSCCHRLDPGECQTRAGAVRAVALFRLSTIGAIAWLRVGETPTFARSR